MKTLRFFVLLMDCFSPTPQEKEGFSGFFCGWDVIFPILIRIRLDTRLWFQSHFSTTHRRAVGPFHRCGSYAVRRLRNVPLTCREAFLLCKMPSWLKIRGYPGYSYKNG